MATGKRPEIKVNKVISGGQTGVDRAALDWAMKRGIRCGGWCPKGRLAEDGKIGLNYPLQETPSEEYNQRTEWNMLQSDASLIISPSPLSGGTAYTHRICKLSDKPSYLASDEVKDIDQAHFLAWLKKHRVSSLNVAGPRESTVPGITQKTIEILEALFVGYGFPDAFNS